ncbi:P-loop containing nucleoside triphosphate hydrolase protein [Wilcoxina mikolae CBS 423.85]|nr:P-loop containing nucleoside triphosphate hydrolase protein [Wilcoxina mikolae CBS 423.85]
MAEVIRQISKGLSLRFIAVIGLTGAGKSSAIKLLTGLDVHVAHGINGGTTAFAMFPAIIGNQRYIFIDTPGFEDGDSTRDNIHVFKDILIWFSTMTPYCDLSGVLCVHDITATRFTASAKLNLDMLMVMCGERFYKNLTILTTKWSTIKPGRPTKFTETRQKQMEEDAWKSMIDGGTRIHRHSGVVEPAEGEHLQDEEKFELEEERLEAVEELRNMMGYHLHAERITPEI